MSASRAASPEERIEAGRRLARSAGRPDVDDRLLCLLLDDEDTGVTQAVAQTLILAQQKAQLRPFLRAYVSPEQSEETSDELGSALFIEDVDWGLMRRLCEEVLSDLDQRVVAGAQEVLKDVLGRDSS